MNINCAANLLKTEEGNGGRQDSQTKSRHDVVTSISSGGLRSLSRGLNSRSCLADNRWSTRGSNGGDGRSTRGCDGGNRGSTGNGNRSDRLDGLSSRADSIASGRSDNFRGSSGRGRSSSGSGGGRGLSDTRPAIDTLLITRNITVTAVDTVVCVVDYLRIIIKNYTFHSVKK